MIVNPQSATTSANGKPAGRGLNHLHWFLVTSGVLLGITGLAKMWGATGGTKVLAVSDPIVGIPFGRLMLVVGLLEVVIAAVCLLRKGEKLPLLLLAWLATSFAVYRIGLWWMGWHRPCGCMGSLTTALHLSDQAADNITKVVLAYLLIGSYGLLVRQWRQERKLLVAG